MMADIKKEKYGNNPKSNAINQYGRSNRQDPGENKGGG